MSGEYMYLKQSSLLPWKGSRKWGAGMAQWWDPERSPPTNVSWVRLPDPASYAGWVCCWFSSLVREVFLRVLRFSPLLKNQRFQIPIRSGIVKHFITSLLLGWLRKHTLCSTLNLHLHFYLVPLRDENNFKAHPQNRDLSTSLQGLLTKF